MATRIRYMGNKHNVASHVATIVDKERTDATFVDAFSGMCFVAGAVARQGRRVVCNDIQGFAALVAQCLIASPEPVPSPQRLRETLASAYKYNYRRLGSCFKREVSEEDAVLRSADAARYRAVYDAWGHTANDPEVAEKLVHAAGQSDAGRYCLVSLSFSWGYFGLRQSIAIDSIRYAIDRARKTGALSDNQCNWALVALLQAASCASASPGHFAQYLRPTTDTGLNRILSQRNRNIWRQFLLEATLLRPYGNSRWRRGNTVLQGDAISLGDRLDELGLQSAVIYADPPYSKDHYSRYYHVLETLTRYDHPTAKGAGRYRPDRFATPFSIKSQVEKTMDAFCGDISERGFSLILSYPSNGLLNDACGVDLTQLLSRHFNYVDVHARLPTHHSTLGARHGSASNLVDEILWVAKPSRC